MSESADDDGVQVDMESSTYSQVVFIDVPRSYPLNTHVTCCYKMTGDLIPSSKDWIGIYKVGWDSVQKYYCYQWTTACLDYKGLEPLTQHILFKESYLPKDDGEFYQFCYVDSGSKVDIQSVQKENERLNTENKGMKCDLERLQEEIKALKVTLSKQRPPEGDKNDPKILTLTNELAEVRGALRKEILNSNEANKRADKAELELKEMKMQLEKRTVAEESRREKFREDIASLQTMIFELSSRSNVSNAQQQQNPLSPAPASPNNTQQQPQTDPYFFEDNRGPFGNPNNAGKKAKVCRHCQESFPDITEEELVTHEQSHKVCPFCTLICDDCGQQEFEDHVYSHEE
ncbi:calcium-binding and coiled-coil domain-containing protein 2 [Silurus asotus]|uniref:Calcium-binding and coiled-coil domain-containing protein 2 n=1 Tax=Silurus asotus TaxID=30991 RepID=A0AAD5AW90_SILAS|nr:calcium-binding and coiled-coil domain-containing protein 2 [Silurus asotus]